MSGDAPIQRGFTYEVRRTYQHRAIDCIACKAGIPTRPARRYIATESVVILPPQSRFNTRRLAAKLTQALRSRTS